MLLCLGLLTQRWIAGLGGACAPLHRHFPMSARYLQQHQQLFAIVGAHSATKCVELADRFWRGQKGFTEKVAEAKTSSLCLCQRGEYESREQTPRIAVSAQSLRFAIDLSGEMVQTPKAG